jgi:hypothetical protein
VKNEDKQGYGIKMESSKGKREHKEKREEGKGQEKLWLCLLASAKGSLSPRSRIDCLVP